MCSLYIVFSTPVHTPYTSDSHWEVREQIPAGTYQPNNNQKDVYV